MGEVGDGDGDGAREEVGEDNAEENENTEEASSAATMAAATRGGLFRVVSPLDARDRRQPCGGGTPAA